MPAQKFSCEFCTIFFKKTLFTEHLHMTAPADSSYSPKALYIDHTFYGVFSSFPFLLLTITIVGICSAFRKGIKMKISSLFTIINPKININVVKTILPQQ